MKKIYLVIFIAVLILITTLFISGYNKLIKLDEEIDNAYHTIESRLQERNDRITQIVASVSGLEEHEKAIYDRIMNARIAYQNAKTTEDLIEADAAQVSALSGLLVVVEDNPNLTASQGFRDLIAEISTMESKLFVARKDYNDAVLKYNNQVRRFPTLLYLRMFDFPKAYSYWKMNNGANEIPQIDFN